jgi:methionyl-tRNA formyltransferase
VRVAVAATAFFGADVLERLAAEIEIAYLLTRPDAHAGRGRKLTAPPAKEAATALGIPVLQPERPELPSDPVDAVVVCAYGLLIPDDLLTRVLWLNVHPSLLPRWRGAAPVERAILAGDEETGVTIHETVKELDAGPIAAQERFPIGPEDDAGAVFRHSAEVAARLLTTVVPAPTFTPQPSEGATYAQKIAPDDRRLDLSNPVDAWRRVRALSPHIGAWAMLHGRRITVWTARLDGGELVPEEVQPEGKRRMSYDEFLRGVREP